MEENGDKVRLKKGVEVDILLRLEMMQRRLRANANGRSTLRYSAVGEMLGCVGCCVAFRSESRATEHCS